MKKLTNLFIVITMGVFLASCGGGNAASSGSSSNAGNTSGSYSNSCLQEVATYINSYNYNMRDLWGSQITYDSVEIDFQFKEVEMNTKQKCYLGDYLCGEYTKSDVTHQENGDKVVYRGEQNSSLFAILNGATKCQKSSYIYEIIKGNTLYHINVSIPQEANPVRVFKRYDDGSYDDYYVSHWQPVI